MLKKNNHRPDDLTVRFPAGTLDKIREVLKARERQTDFIRAAVEEKLRRRGHTTPKSP